MENNKLKDAALGELMRALYDIKSEINRYQELSFENYISLTKYFIALSTGSIVFSFNTFKKVDNPLWLFLTPMICFILTTLFSLGQFYFASKKYKIFENYKKLESQKAQVEYDKIFDKDSFQQSDLDNINDVIREKLCSLKIWNRISLIFFILQSSLFVLGLVTLLIYFIIQKVCLYV